MKSLLHLFFPLLLAAPPCATAPVKSDDMQKWTYPYETHSVELPSGIELAYIDEGRGELTLLMLHGLGSNLQAWTKNVEDWKGDYRCIALDLPNYGKSGRGDYSFTMSFFAQTVAEFIRELGLEKVVVVGHSMGAQIALTMALQEEVVLEKLILLAPAGFETFTEEQKRWFEQLVTPATVKATPEDQIVRNFELNFVNMPDDARFMIDDRLQMRQHEIEYEAYCQMIPKCVQGMLAEPVFDRLPEVTTPSLVIYGKLDALIPNRFLHPDLTIDEVAESGKSRMPNATLAWVDHCGHFLQWECADEVGKLVDHFLQKKD